MTSTTEETTTANSAITDDAALLPINPSASPEPLPTITDIDNDNENETTVVSQGFPDGTTTFEPLTDTTEEEPLPTESTDFFTDVTEATTDEFPTDFPIETTTDNFPFDFSESTTTELPIDFPTESTTDNFPFEFTTSEDPLDSQTDATENQSEATFSPTDASTV
uniref:Uncharacterized protein n=1 Tax=Panagrolaimus superbus TaxID=310955 RepID=A0A914XWC6_9BILA